MWLQNSDKNLISVLGNLSKLAVFSNKEYQSEQTAFKRPTVEHQPNSATHASSI
jgi:hypothetical protein